MVEREDHPAGDSPSDVGQSRQQLEAQPGVFESGRPSSLKPVPENEREELTGVQGPGGDSRPDRRDPGGFESIDDDPRMTTTRDPHDQPQIRKEDPKFLEEHRVDQEDEIVARPGGPGDEEIAILQPRTQQGDKRGQL
jgi:hypothetical protein